MRMSRLLFRAGFLSAEGAFGGSFLRGWGARAARRSGQRPGRAGAGPPNPCATWRQGGAESVTSALNLLYVVPYRVFDTKHSRTVGSAQGFFSPQRRPAKDPEKQRGTRRSANDHRCLHRLSTVLSTAHGRNSPADERTPSPLHFYDTVMRAAGSAGDTADRFLGDPDSRWEALIARARAVGAQSAGRSYGTHDRERVRAIPPMAGRCRALPPT